VLLNNISRTEVNILHEGRAHVWRLIVDPAKGSSFGYFNDVYIYPGQPVPLHSHDEEEIFYFLSGQGEIEIDGEIREVGPYDIVYVPPRTMHATRCKGTYPLRLIAVGSLPTEMPPEYADRVPTMQGRSDY